MFSKKQIRILGLCALAGFLLAFVFLCAGFFCGGSSISGKENRQVLAVLNNYFQAWESAEPGQMYVLLSTADQKLSSLDEYKKQFEEFPVRPAGHQIKNIVVRSPAARAQLLVDWPDFATGKSIPREEIFYLQKEDGAWKVQESVSLEK